MAGSEHGSGAGAGEGGGLDAEAAERLRAELARASKRAELAENKVAQLRAQVTEAEAGQGQGLSEQRSMSEVGRQVGGEGGAGASCI
jgi:hypothetical protein